MAGITQLAADNLSQIWKGEFRLITMCVQTEIGAKAVMFPAKFCLDKNCFFQDRSIHIDFQSSLYS